MCAMDSDSGLCLQLQFSGVLTKWRHFFHQMAAEQGQAGHAAMDKKLEVAALQVECEGMVTMGSWGRTSPSGKWLWSKVDPWSNS